MSTKNVNGSPYVTDTKTNSANTYNLWVNGSGTFKVDESNASSYPNYPLHVVSELMQSFISGIGPENYIFPENGIISSEMGKSDIVQNAISQFKSSNSQESKQYNFTGVNLFKNLVNNSTPFNVDGFVGSGTITIVPTAKGIKVEIFNITSLSSGALTAKLTIGSWLFDMPKSYVRDPSKTTEFGNFSQTYNLFVPNK